MKHFQYSGIIFAMGLQMLGVQISEKTYVL